MSNLTHWSLPIHRPRTRFVHLANVVVKLQMFLVTFRVVKRLWTVRTAQLLDAVVHLSAAVFRLQDKHFVAPVALVRIPSPVFLGVVSDCMLQEVGAALLHHQTDFARVPLGSCVRLVRGD